MDRILKRKEIGVPHFTEDNLQRIVRHVGACEIAPQGQEVESK